ncbi:VWA domain-containing protein [Pseudomonas syringae]|uniref:vWA domain-containing protein n=1 Tax=Pseudomonas TaxID=286 RepID=UPI000356E5BE|nr:MULTISPECIES: VWA domain-containing protein [Pseudomonas]EPM43174.1 von Willebrand factor type A domain-containing protein [Pseudomonas syringae pv. actinidiae ICMP 19073]MBS7432463.1 VWA domain-containing protein [Pseudomonas syringae]PWB30159.1 VWA domain-containing protein [Pseudomonas sp. SDI]QVI82422.1 VWA domain-containing protein [Pseudomonas syringae]RMO81776.1 von Willebrand factor type A domain protein [Pseudomonas syringae pv. maculicola]
MKEEYILSQEDLVDNPTARVPICLVLDVSGSMSGEPIRELQAGVQMFYEAIRDDEIAQYAAEISIVTFGSQAQRTVDFMSIERQDVPALIAEGTTAMGQGVNLALDLLEVRKGDYQRAGVDYYQPWMVIMTDGEPTDDISRASERVRKLCETRKLSVFPIAIGAAANMDTLALLSPGRPPLRLKGLNFKEFFLWLSRSVSRVSQSTPGETVPLDLAGIEAWGQA